jgi:hypothetical protein
MTNRKRPIRSSVDMITVGSRKLGKHLSPDHSAAGGAFIGKFGVHTKGTRVLGALHPGPFEMLTTD